MDMLTAHTVITTRIRVLFFAAFFWLFGIVASTVASAAPAEEFRYRLREDLGTLDWSYGEVNAEIVLQLMDGLSFADAQGHAKPALAKSWTFDSKRNRFVFSIRKAVWSDGQPVCASQFRDAWLRALDPDLASPFAHYFFVIRGAQAFHQKKATREGVGVSAPSCDKLEVTLEHPAAYFPELTSHWVYFPVRVDLIAKFGKDWTRPENLVVTGAYVLKDWQKDRAYALEANPKYWNTPPKTKKLRAFVVPDDASALALYRTGRLDWSRDLPFLEKPALSKQKDFRAFPTLVDYFLGFDLRGSGFTQGQRCALAHALDKRQIPKFLHGKETPAWNAVHPALAKLPPRRALDTARAKSLWADGPKKIELHYYAKDIHEPLMHWIAEEWRRVLGIEVELKKNEGKTYWAKLQTNPPAIFLSGTTAAYGSPYAFLSEFLPESSANWGRFRSEEFTAALHALADAQNRQAANAAASRADRAMVEDACAIIPLYFRTTSTLVASPWKGFEMNPLTYVYLKNVRKD